MNARLIPPRALIVRLAADLRANPGRVSPVAVADLVDDSACWGALYWRGSLRIARSTTGLVTIGNLSAAPVVDVASLPDEDRATLAEALADYHTRRARNVERRKLDAMAVGGGA